MNATVLKDPGTARAGLVSVDGQAYPLESAAVDARAEGGMALTTLRQRFRNPHNEALEVLYALPLPADGAVLGYEIQVGERRIVGEVRSRDEAQAAYREALYEGRTAGLLEEERADTFTQRLGNIPGKTPVEVEIRVLHPLGFREGGAAAEWEYRFPTALSVRYMGAPGRVKDPEKLHPDRAAEGIPTRLSLDLHLGDATGAEGIHSPSHRIRTGPGRGPLHETGQGARVSLAESSRLDRDVVVRWPALGRGLETRIVEGEGLEGDDGRYALLTLLPPGAPEAVMRRDLTVLVDASGSMHGPPLAVAKELISDLLGSLDPGDRFELLAFSTSVERLTREPVHATPAAIRRALGRLEALTAGGGTEMQSALQAALRPLRQDAQRQVILVTDGYIAFEEEVLREAARSLPEGVRIHVVGVGSAPNRTLTRGLTRAGRGRELFVGEGADARETARLLRNATAGPVLTELSVGGSAVRAMAPARPHDVLAGRPALLTLELAAEGGAVEVTGRLPWAEEPWWWSVQVPPVDDGVADRGAAEALVPTPLPLGALHGRERVADLELELAAGADRSRIEKRIEACGLRHRIVTRRTSLVAMAEEPSVDPREPRRRERLAVELPAGVSAEGVGLVREARAHFMRGPALSKSLPLANLDASPSGPVGELVEERSSLYDAFRAMPRRRRPFRPRKRVPPTQEPDEMIIRDAEVLHRTPHLLAVEFEVPFEGCSLPPQTVTVRLEDGREVEAEVDPWGSTEGTHLPAGVRVRLALRAPGGFAWPQVDRVDLKWSV
jgi:Ca-activated chloride channel homolog